MFIRQQFLLYIILCQISIIGISLYVFAWCYQFRKNIFCELSSTGIFDVCCIMQSKIKPHHQTMRPLIKNVLSDSDEQLNIKTSWIEQASQTNRRKLFMAKTNLIQKTLIIGFLLVNLRRKSEWEIMLTKELITIFQLKLMKNWYQCLLSI